MIEFVLEAMVDPLLVVDAEGRVTLANTAASRITVRSREELRGMPIASLLVDYEGDGGMKTVVRRKIEEGDVRREESWLVAKDGRRIPVSVTAAPVIGANGEVQGIVLVARDIRELQQLLADKESEILRRRRAEEELKAAKTSIETQLEQARKMLVLAERRATLGTLAGGVGHELRNIAQIQVAAVDQIQVTLQAGENLDTAVRDILPDLERVGEHITLHGQKLMQLARPGPDHVAPIDISTVVRDVAAMLELAGKLGTVKIELQLPDEPLTVTVNRTRIEQILVNLVINAVDAITGEGTVTVAAHADAARVVCEVRDTGKGIPRGELKKIFEPFFTTKGEHGTGLGLPVVRDIVESYGGVLAVKSEVGTGTTFTFDLPR